jgi:aryl-alcohol dehydrogenase-like predicted oxidoreductase
MSIGLGTWGLGGKAYGSVQRDVAIKTIEEAIKLDVRVFDTANIYGDGRAEELLGATLPNNKDYTIITKVGYIKEFSYTQDFSEKAIVTSVNRSLARLQRNSIDILLLHSPDIAILNNDTVKFFLETMIAQGIIGRVGVSVRDIASIQQAVNWSACSVIEVVFNLLDQRVLDNGLLELCDKNNIDVIARVPLCFGILTGKYKENPVFTDQRSRWSVSQLNRWVQGARLFSFLETQKRSLSQAALAFCIFQSGISWVIPGAKSPEQLEQNTSNIYITENEIVKIRSIWKEHHKDILPL